MSRWLAVSILLIASVLLSACETDKPADSEVTSLPWNRPQSWEGQGPLGGFQQQGR